jgi:hypothetical protein
MPENNSAQKEKKVLTNGNQVAYSIWQKVEAKAEKLGYGVICCEITVHDGKVKQLEITGVRERYRVD